jgi:hypothetical protein
MKTITINSLTFDHKPRSAYSVIATELYTKRWEARDWAALLLTVIVV